MSRVQATLVAVAFFTVQICCAPLLRAAAFEAVEPATCPMDRAMPCEAGQQEECSGGPDLTATPATNAPAVTPGVVVVPSSYPHPHPLPLAGASRGDFWSAQTRTIQLRI